MNRLAVALIAAFEAFVAAAIVFGAALVTASLLWAVQYGLHVDWAVFARGAADAWLIGHGVDLRVALDAATAAAIGSSGVAPFRLSIAALGVALVVVLLAVRAGRRAARGDSPVVALAAGAGTYLVLGLVVAALAASPVARPSLWQSIVLPPFVYALGLAVGALLERPDAVGGAPLAARLGESARRVLGAALRVGSIATALLLAASAVVLALSLAVRYDRVVALYEGLHAGAFGGAVLTLAQLALLPNAVVWTASWLAGPGFAVGAGSSVSPLGSQLGPIPGIPLLGALPQGELVWGFAGLAVPLVSGFAAALLARPSFPDGGRRFLAALAAGAVAGAELGLLAWWSGGAAGPGRLQEVGPEPWLAGVVVALEIAVGAALAAVAFPRRAPAASRPVG